MTITFLGTNGWYDTETGLTACILIETDSAYIVLDAGNGIYKLDRYLKDPKKPIYLFLSHLHLDHVFGLHILNKFHFPQGMKVCVPSSFMPHLKVLLSNPFTLPLELLPTKTEFVELDKPHTEFPFTVSAIPLIHISPNFGYRFTLDGKILSYSGDTRICEKSGELANNADILIHECTFEPGHDNTNNWGHSSPEEVAKLAVDAHVKKLLLTHFEAPTYTNLEMRKDAEKVAQAIFPESYTVVDDEAISVL
jgi:ribonuclease BN (tRNA processing enzyme)